MNRQALINVGIASVIYTAALLLLLYAQLPSALGIVSALLVGPTNFLFCSIDPRWGLFSGWVVVVAAIVLVGALKRGAGFAASSVALLVWLGTGVYAVLFNAETC